jgi:hypothetical protein
MIIGNMLIGKKEIYEASLQFYITMDGSIGADSGFHRIGGARHVCAH